MVNELDKAVTRKELKESRFNGLAYWEIFEPIDTAKRKAIVHGTYDQAVDYAVEQDYFLVRNSQGPLITAGTIRKLDIEVVDLTNNSPDKTSLATLPSAPRSSNDA